MKKAKWLFLFPALLIACRQQEVADDRLIIAASIAPLADFCRQVGGERVSVFTIVPSGANPHTFELDPQLLIRISEARLLVLNGLGLEYWADKVADNFSSRDLQVITVSQGIPVLQDEDHAEGNPHVWLNPLHAARQAEKITGALMRLDPLHAQTYRDRSDQYQKVLHDLDVEISREIAGWQNRRFICFHPSWNYFSERYHLEQAAVIEKRPGFEPSPGEAAEIIGLAKRLQVRAIFAEQQFPLKIAEMIAAESGARVLVLDPLGSDGEGYSYVSLLRTNVAQMAIALR
ncbi:MAG TPA: metal ABC transporter substrate-binding protein [bacterium]|nr:metal ABC transporter substrate-binding protein [bacterium]